MVRCNCLVCSMPYGNSVLLVMQCVVAFTWCIQSFPSSYIPLLDSSSDGVNRMCSCVILFFFCSWYLSFSPGLSFCLDWNLHWAIPFSLLPATVTHLSLLIRSKPHQKKKCPFSLSTSHSPHFSSQFCVSSSSASDQCLS